MAIAQEISIPEFAEMLNKGDLVKQFQEQIFYLFLDALLEAKEPMAKRSPVDTGLYAGSWDTKPDFPKAIFFGNQAPYAEIIEFGARPFSPPIRPLLEWGARKLKKDVNDPEVKSLAWGTKRKFEREGMEALHVLGQGMEEVIMPLLQARLEGFRP